MGNTYKLSVGAFLSFILFFGLTNFRFENPTFPDNLHIDVTLIEARIIDKNGIGNEWFFTSNIENANLSEGIPLRVDLSGKTKIKIISTAIEEDPSSDDVGKNELTITPANLNQLTSSSLISKDVFVKEYNGKGAGKTATCKFTYKISQNTNGFASLK